VVLWTRVVPDKDLDKSVSVAWEVATDSQSSVGTTLTLPEGSVNSVRLAVVSCANYPAGYFNVYREISKRDDLDAVVHLGDYLYEYSSAADSYGAEDAATLNRTFPADNDLELIRLKDYRRRYGIYRGDADLQTLHRKVPFIVVWDDHEIANDAWETGAGNHSAGEGDYGTRKLEALQAYFEWMPIRPVIEGNDEAIFRTFRFGNLVDLHMLDTRHMGRDEQLDYLDYFTTGGELDQARFIADVGSTNRTLLGAEQLLWLQASLGYSTATWQVLGQQILMGRMNLPAEMLVAIATENFAGLPQTLGELAQLKGRKLASDPTLTVAEQGIGLLVDDLDYLNINQRGYMVVTFTAQEARADWYFVDTIKSREYVIDTARSASRVVRPGAGNRHVEPAPV